MSTKPERPYYVPEAVWLGKKVGEWPILAFESEEPARRWAAEQPDAIGAERARRIWRVEIPADVVTYRVSTVPARTAMEATL